MVHVLQRLHLYVASNPPGLSHGPRPCRLIAGMAQRSGGVAQYVVDGEDVALKAGYLKKCALSTGAIRKCAEAVEPVQTRGEQAMTHLSALHELHDSVVCWWLCPLVGPDTGFTQIAMVERCHIMACLAAVRDSLSIQSWRQSCLQIRAPTCSCAAGRRSSCGTACCDRHPLCCRQCCSPTSP